MARGRWRLTVRAGSEVRREKLQDAAEAVDALRREADAVRAEGPLSDVNSVRSFTADQRVAARLEISGPGFRGKEAGVDVRGDGRLVAYTGAITKHPLEAASDEELYARLLERLEG